MNDLTITISQHHGSAWIATNVMTTVETDADDRNGSDLLIMNVVVAAPNFLRLHQQNIFIAINPLPRLF